MHSRIPDHRLESLALRPAVVPALARQSIAPDSTSIFQSAQAPFTGRFP